MLINTVIIINWLILLYLFVLTIIQIGLSLISLEDDIFRYNEIKIGDVLPLMSASSMPAVTVLIAAYNEEKDIIQTIQSVLKSTYQNIFILISSDGSTDNTVPMLVRELEMRSIDITIEPLIPTNSKINNYYISDKYPNISLVDKEHCDKSDTLNIGVNACNTSYFITVDADTLLDPNAISEIMFCAITKTHPVAVGGAVYISNGCTFKDGEVIEARMPYQLIPAYQTCEYLRSFLFNRTGWNQFGGSICYSGAFTLFDREAIIQIGGFEVHNFANDFEIVTHLQSYRLANNLPYQLCCTPAATCWTDVPTTLKSFLHQRTLWQIGSLKSLSKHMYMLFNPRYKMIGLFNFPFFLFFETLSPLVEFTAYVSMVICWYLDIMDIWTAAMFILACYGFILLYTLSTLLLNVLTFGKYVSLKDIPWVVFVSTSEFIGFRQLHIVWRVMATFKFLYEKIFKG